MKTLKKLLLSIGVIVAFIAYSFQQRRSSVPTIVASSSLATNTTQPTNSTGSNSTTTPTPTPTSNTNSSGYKDGSYTGDSTDAFYGIIQVKATISGGKITDVVFLQYPNDRGNSVYINSQAMPILKQEAIQSQSSHVNIVTGATDSSMAFIQSLASALSKAQ